MRWLILTARWFCVPLVFLAVLALVGLAGTGIVKLLDERCATSAMVGGACVASWHTTGIEWVVYVGLFVSVFVAIVLAARAAPFRRVVIASICGIAAVALPLSIWLGLGWNDFRLISIEAMFAAAISVWRVK